MAITNVGELSAAVADFLNREDLDNIMGTLIDNAQDRILFDPRFRGELTETLITKRRTGYDLVNPLRTASFWDSATDMELDDIPITYIDDFSGQEVLENPPYVDTGDTVDLEIVRLYIDNQEYTRVNDYSDILNAEANEYLYCEVGGKYYLSGWEIEDTSFSDNPDDITFTFVANEKIRIDDAQIVDPIDDSVTVVATSRALRQYPNIFLYATLVEAAIYLRDAEYMAVYQARYEELMGKLEKDWKRKQISSGFNVRSVPRRNP